MIYLRKSGEIKDKKILAIVRTSKCQIVKVSWLESIQLSRYNRKECDKERIFKNDLF